MSEAPAPASAAAPVAASAAVQDPARGEPGTERSELGNQRSELGTTGGVLTTTRRLLWALVVPMFLLLVVLTALQYEQLMGEAERDLLRRAGERAQELEAAARPVMGQVADLREWLQANWQEPPDAGPRLARALTAHRHGERHDGWSLDEAAPSLRDQLGQVWWAPTDGRAPDELWLRRARGFNELARIGAQRLTQLQATWFAAAEVNASFGYPWVSTSDMLRAMGQPSLQAVDKPRQEAVARSERELARDPEDISFWGAPYVSQLDGQGVVSHGAVVVVDGRYRGEVSVDLRLESLQNLVERWRDTDSRSWIIDKRQFVLADSVLPLAAPKGVGLADQRIAMPLADRLPQGLNRDDIERSMIVPDAARHGAGWVLVSAVRIGSPFVYVQAVPLATLRATVLPTLAPNALLALALGLMFVAGQWLMQRFFVRPSVAVLDYLQRLSQDAEAARPALSGRWSPWLDVVSDTLQRLREAQLRERRSETFKAGLIDGAPVAVFVADAQGDIIEFNRAAEQLFGVPREQAVGRFSSDIVVPPRHRAASRAAVERVRAGQLEEGFDRPAESVGWHHPSGREFPMEVRGYRMATDGGTCYTVFLTDLTERKHAAEQIARQREALRQSEKLTAMGSLLASVAHELNNPLTIVVGRASLIEDKAAGTPMATDASRIREAAERCGRIVRTFLAMARQKPATRTRVQLNDLVRAAAELLGYTFKSHAIDLRLLLAEDLPEVMADADQIGQVVLNLLVNAQQALAAGTESRAAAGQAPRNAAGGEPRPAARRIEVRSGVEGDQVWLRVIDSGPGVPEALREQIFDPFFTTKGEGSGTGLGLPVSRSIAREHGGDLLLEAAATAGPGASFLMRLPMAALKISQR